MIWPGTAAVGVGLFFFLFTFEVFLWDDMETAVAGLPARRRTGLSRHLGGGRQARARAAGAGLHGLLGRRSGSLLHGRRLDLRQRSDGRFGAGDPRRGDGGPQRAAFEGVALGLAVLSRREASTARRGGLLRARRSAERAVDRRARGARGAGAFLPRRRGNAGRRLPRRRQHTSRPAPTSRTLDPPNVGNSRWCSAGEACEWGSGHSRPCSRWTRSRSPRSHGVALGGGACIATAVDFRVGAESCRVGYPEIDLGINLQWMGLPLCVHLIGPARAKRMVILGQHETAPTLLEWGFLDEMVPDDELLDRRPSTWPRPTPPSRPSRRR